MHTGAQKWEFVTCYMSYMIYIHIHTYIHTYIYTYIHTYITYTHTDTHTHTHTHTHMIYRCAARWQKWEFVNSTLTSAFNAFGLPETGGLL